MPTVCVVAERKEGCKASCGMNPRGLVGWVSVSVHTIRCRIAKLLCSSGYTDRSRVLLVIFLLYFIHIKVLIWDSPLLYLKGSNGKESLDSPHVNGLNFFQDQSCLKTMYGKLSDNKSELKMKWVAS